jgi:hypothetical protein
LLVQPGDGADLDPAAEGTVALGHIEGVSLAHEEVTRKVRAQTTMFEALLLDATPKDGALASARLPLLIATAAAKAILVRIAQFAIAATDGSQPPAQAVPMTHAPIIAETCQVSKTHQASALCLLRLDEHLG